MKNLFILLFIFIVMFCNESSAQTAQETIDWINVTLTKMRRDTEYTTMGYSAVIIKDSISNDLHLVIGFDAKSPKDEMSAVVHIPLKNVVVCEVEKENRQNILFITRTGTMDGIVMKNGEPTVMNYHSYKMVFENNKFNKSMMKRLVKAFQHLIKLAGGNVPKEGLFYDINE